MGSKQSKTTKSTPTNNTLQPSTVLRFITANYRYNNTNYGFNGDKIDCIEIDNNWQIYQLVEQKQFAKACEQYSRLEKINSTDGRLKINLSYCLFHLKSYQESYNKANQAIIMCCEQLKPKAYFRCGEALRELNRSDQALRMFERVLNNRKDCVVTKNRIELIESEMKNVERQTRNSVLANKAEHSRPGVQSASTPVRPQLNVQNIKNNAANAKQVNFQQNAILPTNDRKPIVVSEVDDEVLKLRKKVEESTQRILKGEHDFQLYISRSQCHYLLKNYYLSFVDASHAISLNSQNVGGYYRAALALKGMENYEQSENMLTKADQLMPNCDLIISELRFVRSRVVRKEESLANGMPSNMARKRQTLQIEKAKSLTNLNAKPAKHVLHNKPTNILQLNALMVKNLNADLSYKFLMGLFSKFGVVKKLYFARDFNRCYVNYDNSESPVEAIEALHGFNKEDVCLKQNACLVLTLIPSNDQRTQFNQMSKQQMIKLIRESKECDDWRRNDCILDGKCPYEHIPINKGIETLLNRQNKIK